MNWFVFYRFALSTIRFQTKAFYLNLMVKNLYKKNKNDDDDQINFFLILENKLMLLYLFTNDLLFYILAYNKLLF